MVFWISFKDQDLELRIWSGGAPDPYPETGSTSLPPPTARTVEIYPQHHNIHALTTFQLCHYFNHFSERSLQCFFRLMFKAVWNIWISIWIRSCNNTFTSKYHLVGPSVNFYWIVKIFVMYSCFLQVYVFFKS